MCIVYSLSLAVANRKEFECIHYVAQAYLTINPVANWIGRGVQPTVSGFTAAI
jgi:hypothetical protein